MSQLIIVTGAAGSVGQTLMAKLAASGLAIAGLDLAPAFEVPGAQSAVLPGVDLSDERQVADAFSRVHTQFGKADGLVNVAGGFAWETIADGSLATWDRLYAINLRSAVVMCRAALDHLSDGASIVNVGALAATKADTGMAAYAASKAGVARLTEALAAELKPRGIRVNAVLPSIVDTDANRRDMPAADFAQWVTREELAEVISFLLSQQASAITGALIPIAGRV